MHIRFFQFFLAFFLSVGMLLPAHAQLDKTMKKGQQAFRTRKYAEALKQFNAVIKADPSYPQVFVYRGMVYYAQAQYSEAEIDFQRALEQDYYGSPSRFNGGFGTDPRITTADAAKIHNNRGMALYYLEDYTQAAQEFRKAQLLDPNLKVAKVNYDDARKVAKDPTVKPDGTGTSRNQSGLDGNTYVDNRPELPANRARATTRVDKAQVSQNREYRMVNQGIRKATRKTRPYKFRRRKGFGTSVYERPFFEAASRDYLLIERVVINREATLVTFRMNNSSFKNCSVCIAPSSSDMAFYITDRSGRYSQRWAMNRLIQEGSKLSSCPNTTQMRPGDAVTFTIEFERIPDDLGYINIIEGKRKDGDEWNFYNVDLTRE